MNIDDFGEINYPTHWKSRARICVNNKLNLILNIIEMFGNQILGES